MYKIRTTHIANFIDDCEVLLELKLLLNKEGVANERMKAGSLLHKQIENSFDKGEIHPQIKNYYDFLMNNYEINNWLYEKAFEIQYNSNFIVTGHPDFEVYLKDPQQMIIVDWKGTKLDSSIKEKNVEITISKLLGYWQNKMTQPYFYSYKNFKKHPKLQKILFFYCFPCLPFDGTELQYISFEINRVDCFSFVKIAMNKIIRAISINTFFPTNSLTKCNECIMRTQCYIIQKSLKVIEEVNSETSKANITNLIRNINSPDSQSRLGDILFKIEGEQNKIKILKTKIEEEILKLINEFGGESLQIRLKDKLMEIKQGKNLETIINEETTIEFLMQKCGFKFIDIINCSNLSLSLIQKKLEETGKEVPKEQIKSKEQKKTINVLYLKK